MATDNVEQIRELLVGDFEKETRNEFKNLKNMITELREEKKRELENISKSLKSEIDQINRFLEDKYAYLEETMESKFNVQKNFTENELRAVKKDIAINKDFTSKTLESLKNSFDLRLKDLRNENFHKNVAKESLASMFFEYALKLKNSNIENELKTKMKQSNETATPNINSSGVNPNKDKNVK